MMNGDIRTSAARNATVTHGESMTSINAVEITERDVFAAVLSEKDFRSLSEFVYERCGIKLPPAKKTMVEGRLRKRLRSLQMSSFHEYCDYLFSAGALETESVHLIDLVTTNKTDFFREPAHFECLFQKVLPELRDVYGLGARTRLNVWSAGCSSGEEPYTLAMVLSEFAEESPGFGFSVLATDISTVVLEKAVQGIFEHERIEPVPVALRKKYLLRSRNKPNGRVRICDELRASVQFGRLNLMDDEFPIRDPMGVIFCRNVMIYFDRSTQRNLIEKFGRHLVPGGYLFMGHSESLHGMRLTFLEPVKGFASVYRRL
jgi:chemotaxis protein methyltransferase CheR